MERDNSHSVKKLLLKKTKESSVFPTKAKGDSRAADTNERHQISCVGAQFNEYVNQVLSGNIFECWVGEGHKAAGAIPEGASRFLFLLLWWHLLWVE